MKLSKLSISNFRAIARLELDELPDTIVIAGPNGSGKSSIFDAIRLLKSHCGQYERHEENKWFKEKGVSPQPDRSHLQSIFRDKSKSLTIEAEFTLSDNELRFLANNRNDVARSVVHSSSFPSGDPFVPTAPPVREQYLEITARAQSLSEDIASGATQPVHTAGLEITPTLDIKPRVSPFLHAVLSAYIPKHIGIIDFHGPNRSYRPEESNNINIRLLADAQATRRSHLYDYQQKYTNIKSELAASYVRELISSNAKDQSTAATSLSETLQELFETFFPGKSFKGPIVADGASLSFPVETETGSIHDINALSSGEKEVLFGYLRLRNNCPRNSIILLDEPEMHLNPALVRGLPGFYRKHIGKEMGNQLWFATHSDVLLRGSLGEEGVRVFHMQAAEVSTRQTARSVRPRNQAAEVRAEGELDEAIISLTGDLATLSPKSPILIFEGEGANFDKHMVSRLFPEIDSKFNTVCAGGRESAQRLNQLIREATLNLGTNCYCIVDRDSDQPAKSSRRDPAEAYKWDRYHIENYLLDAEYILTALNKSSRTQGTFTSQQEVEDALRACAAEAMPELTEHAMQNKINGLVRRALAINVKGMHGSLAIRFRDSIANAKKKLDNVLAAELSEASLTQLEETTQKEHQHALTDGSWKSTFRGRTILKLFCRSHGNGINYVEFRDSIVTAMETGSYEPPGMANTLSKVASQEGLQVTFEALEGERGDIEVGQ